METNIHWFGIPNYMWYNDINVITYVLRTFVVDAVSLNSNLDSRMLVVLHDPNVSFFFVFSFCFTVLACHNKLKRFG